MQVVTLPTYLTTSSCLKSDSSRLSEPQATHMHLRGRHASIAMKSNYFASALRVHRFELAYQRRVLSRLWSSCLAPTCSVRGKNFVADLLTLKRHVLVRLRKVLSDSAASGSKHAQHIKVALTRGVPRCGSTTS